MGEFYYELSVKVAEVCFATRTQNGGIMSVSQALDILNRSSSSSSSSSRDSKTKKYNEGDIKIAVKKLGQLGGGFRIVQVGGGGKDGSRNSKRGGSSSSDMIVSVPTELDEDHTSILTLASGQGGCVTVDDVQKHMSNWSKERIDRAITLLLQEGMAWKDEFHGIDFYWIPSVWKEQQQQL
mmetsp:Transcript_42944/g.103822  ORF Transcript_42944/g.103822 Transcript_42944/m.103822 type:complete len:181 (-) Transcript_42944:224-766(-)